jgi:hypothetical protein
MQLSRLWIRRWHRRCHEAQGVRRDNLADKAGGEVTDQGIEVMFLGKTNGNRCLLGTLTRRSAK